MDIYHWWLIKMVAIQLLCLLGIAWGVRYLWLSRAMAAKRRKEAMVLATTESAPTPTFNQNQPTQTQLLSL